MTLLAALQGLRAPSGAVLAGCRESVTALGPRRGMQQAEAALCTEHNNASTLPKVPQGPSECWGVTAHLALPSNTAVLEAWTPSLDGHTACWDPHPAAVPGSCHGCPCAVLSDPGTAWGEKGLPFIHNLGQAASSRSLGSELAASWPPAGTCMLDSPLWSISLAAVETNIVMVNVQGAWPSPTELCGRLSAVREEDVAEAGQAVRVLLLPCSADCARSLALQRLGPWH